MSRPLYTPCPKCEAKSGEQCRRVNGTGMVAMHQERVRAAQTTVGGVMPPRRRRSRVVKRFGAFLMMYGPRDAPTHAVLKLGHGPEPNTPRGFLLELETQERTENHGKAHGIGTEWRLHFDGRPRVTPPLNPVRILNTIWPPCSSRPPMVCAGLRQMTPDQAREVGQKLGQTPTPCGDCGHWHVKGKRHG